MQTKIKPAPRFYGHLVLQEIGGRKKWWSMIISGGSRISRTWGANKPIFCQKLHENERIWTERGARVSDAPLDLPLITITIKVCPENLKR